MGAEYTGGHPWLDTSNLSQALKSGFGTSQAELASHHAPYLRNRPWGLC